MWRTFFLFFCFISITVRAQQEFSVDSVWTLSELVVQGYRNDRPLTEVPASIGFVSLEGIEGLNNTSILPVVNTIPGVRMEERSPGSYRFAIRGSSLRSPFGVRNVKMYWNGLPLTDAGGNTYLNLIDFNSINNIEIIKGPGGSLYGAGTGGVVLINSADQRKEWNLTTLVGSYGLQRYQLGGELISTKNTTVNSQLAYQKSDGYREQTKMERLAFSLGSSTSLTKTSTLSTTLFATGLFYETPGGLTLSQFESNPRQARPATATQPGAAEQKASVKNNTVFIGLQYENEWNDHWSSKLGVYGSHTDFKNPAIRNYEKRKESNWGTRIDSQYKFGNKTWKGKLTLGGEYQYLFSPIYNYDNLQGEVGNLQYNDDITANQGLLFVQTEFDIPKNFFVTIGASVGFLKYHFVRQSDVPPNTEERKFDPEISPRVALIKKIGQQFSIYGSINEGFSAPTLAEVRPSAGEINTSLNAERGINYEMGIRFGFLKRTLTIDVTAYQFQLKESIVIRYAADGAEYFINSGGTSQKGFEAAVSWNPILPQKQLLTAFTLWGSYTLNNYRFKNYIQGTQDFSGNSLTGTSPNIAVGGIDLAVNDKIYFSALATYTDHIPLNDGNTQYARYFILFGARGGYKFNINEKLPFEFFSGVDNILDSNYSLGNDLNASGGRYYNATAGRNFYIGLKASLVK